MGYIRKINGNYYVYEKKRVGKRTEDIFLGNATNEQILEYEHKRESEKIIRREPKLVGSTVIELCNRKIEVKIVESPLNGNWTSKRVYAKFIDGLSSSAPTTRNAKTKIEFAGKSLEPEKLKRLKELLAEIPDEEV